MAFIEYTISGIGTEQQEILIALLENEGFDSFWQQETELKAYAESADKVALIEEQLNNLQISFDRIAISPLADINWNEAWEANFQPVEIADKIRIRAAFHSAENAPEYDLIIQPKMAFGTGHHGTTAGVMQLMLGLDLHGKSVLDAGCGTGILAILAAKMGALKVLAFDNDHWAVENALENLSLNGVDSAVEVRHADLQSFSTLPCDVVIANITRNTITAFAGVLVRWLAPGGTLIVSGFYTEDFTVIEQHFQKFNLFLTRWLVTDNWVAAIFTART